MDPLWAFARYEQVRERLPTARFASVPQSLEHLGQLTEDFDAFVFDSFGVLNVGDTPIENASRRITQLRNAGKQVCVLTNAATGPLSQLPAKYRTLGFDFAANEIISSREILANALRNRQDNLNWGIIAPAHAQMEELPGNNMLLCDGDADFNRPDGFVILSSQSIDEQTHSRLAATLSRHRQRPVLVGNPDLVAPREDGFSREPGFYAHDLADRLDITPVFFGKPFANAFDEVRRRLGPAIAAHRIAMIGDTLHTDILGGASAGFRTVLVTAHGVMKDLDVPECIDHSGIVPDFIMPSI